MKPPEIDAQFVFKWIVEHILYFFCVVLIFLGSVFYSVFDTDNTTTNPQEGWKRAVVMLFAVTLMGLSVGYLIDKFSLNPFIMCIVATVLGVGAKPVSLWILEIWRKAKGFEDLFARAARLVRAFRKAQKEIELEDDSPPDTHD